MKRALSVLLILGALTAAAEDSYLYWMIGDTSPYTTAAGDNQYTTVRFRADDNEYLTILAPDGKTELGKSISADEINSVKNNGGALYANLGSNPSYSSFVVELLNDSGFVAKSETISYSEALANYYIQTANSMALPTAWAATSFAIPEPNSGLLMLLGCAALGLRRRRLNRS